MSDAAWTAVCSAFVTVVLAGLQIWREYLNARRADMIKKDLAEQKELVISTATEVKKDLAETNAKTDVKLTRIAEDSQLAVKLADSAILGQKEREAIAALAKAEDTKATADKISARVAQKQVEEHLEERQKREAAREAESEFKSSHGDLGW